MVIFNSHKSQSNNKEDDLEWSIYEINGCKTITYSKEIISDDEKVIKMIYWNKNKNNLLALFLFFPLQLLKMTRMDWNNWKIDGI